MFKNTKNETMFCNYKKIVYIELDAETIVSHS